MATDSTSRPTGPASRSALVALWCTVWLVVGAWTGYEMWQLSSLSSTVADSGRALDEAGIALESLGQVPFVGDRTAALGADVRANGADIMRSADDAGTSIRRLAVLLGFVIALVPSVPAVVAHRVLAGRTRNPF